MTASAGSKVAKGRAARLLLGVVLALGVLLGPAQAAMAVPDPDGVSFTLEGCRNSGTIALPNGSGDFICPDAAYTTGNLGKGWNELDLVPYRLIAKAGNSAPATQTYRMAVALDNKDSGAPGYDVLSALVKNAAKSAAGCSITVHPEALKIPGVGGIDETRYRLVDITQAKGTECVFDFYGRLALGSHLFPGSSLHANKLNQNLGTAGVGAADVSIPVREILPQELKKDMSATQGSDHVWNIEKEPTPAHVEFPDTCDPAQSGAAGVTVTVTWEKLAATPSGPITVITHVYATNPAARVITVDVSDDIRGGTTVLDTAASGPIDVAANTTQLVLTHQTEVPAGTTDLNDVATATYTDKVTGVPVPGTTTATASADVQSSGVTTDQSATVTDEESISGTGFSYSTNTVSLAGGTFSPAYTLGLPAPSPLTWTSPTQNAGGSVTFGKSVYVASGASGNGTLSDTAKIAETDSQTSKTAEAEVTIQASKFVELRIDKSISGAVFATDQTFTFQVFNAANTKVADVEITVPAGETTESATLTGLLPDSYTVVEEQRTGFGPVDTPGAVDLRSACSGSVSFTNSFAPAKAAAKKVTQPAGSEAGWEMTLTDVTDAQNPVVVETKTTDGSGDAGFAATLLDGHSYTITETPQDGWDAQTPTGECSFTVSYPADADKTFSCTFTNVQRGKIVVEKVTDPAGDAQQFGFSGDLEGDIGDGGSISKSVAPGTYTTTESVPDGWDLTDITCDDTDSTDTAATATYKVAAGETVTCTYTNTKRAKIVVKKVTDPAGDAQKFTFAGELAGDIGDGGSISKSVAPGTYTTTESVPDGWDLTKIACDDTDSSGDTGTAQATYKVAAGETVTCTYTNTKRGKIIVKKVTKPAGDPQQFGFSGDLQGDIGDGGSISKTVVPGTYTTTESVPDGWDLTDITCNDTDSTDTGATATYKVAAGETVTCTYTNTKRGKIIVKKVTDPAGDAQKFTFAGELAGAIGDGEQLDKVVKPGTYTTTETVPSGWDLTKIACDDTDSAGTPATAKATYAVAPGETVTCTYTNTKRGHVKVVKTVTGAPPSGTQAFTFQLRQGATPIASGTTLETKVANAANGGNISFSTDLVPGQTYQLCEIVMPAWLSSLGTFVPASFIPPDGAAPDPTVDNSIVCVNFSVTAGETKTISVDNTPPPGGRALTIGFWKNWASCSKGGQKPVLDQTLAKAEPDGIKVGTLTLHGSTLTPDKAPSCLAAVNLLNKSTITGAKKMASDPIFNMAAQYVAAKLNIVAGAGTNGSVLCNIASAQALMLAVSFNGNTHNKLTAAQSTKANQLASLLDDYNNNRPVTTCVAYP